MALHTTIAVRQTRGQRIVSHCMKGKEDSMSLKRISAVSLATLMATTSVASAAPANATDVFSTSNENTVISMTGEEMANTQGELAFSTGLALAGAFTGGVTLGAGTYLTLRTHFAD
jgi:hypothetical protein